MKLIVSIFITLGIAVSILTYLQPEFFNGLASLLFNGPIWTNAVALLAVFGAFFNRLFNNTYILLLVGVNLIFYILRLFVNLLTARRTAAFNATKNAAVEGQETNTIQDSDTRINTDSAGRISGSSYGSSNRPTDSSRENSRS